jgi:toxin CcdB
MPQFDVFKTSSGGIYPLVIDVQADLHEKLATRVVVPLATRRSYGAAPMTRLLPTVDVLGTSYVVLTTLMAAIPTSVLGTAVANVRAQRPALLAALDMLITGG